MNGGIEDPDVTQAQGGLEADLRIAGRSDGPALGAQQAIEKRVDLAVALIGAAPRGHRALAGFAVIIAERFDGLRAGAFAGLGVLDEHGGGVTRVPSL